MTPERWQKVKDILDTLEATAVDRRRATLETVCSGDVELLQEVESFLEFDEEIDEFIEDPLWSIQGGGPTDADLDDSTALHLVGPYRLHRLLGRGGMGAVYLAQREGDYEQQVALKLVNWGMDSEEILARFLTERQILANLQHPGIARLLDGGTTEENLPYFAMEYVEGEPIDVYCERCKLTLSERLKLFRKVCAAVHFAHQNLVVHRDLKPSNILVTEDGEPKLLDFGIAKLLQSEKAARTFATVTGQGPMTPDYASPEQIMNSPITTACDVYAMGVLLYRLLTGLPPYRLRDKGYAEIVDVICKVEPSKPSTAVHPDTVALRENMTSDAEAISREETRQNTGESRRLRRLLTGDLDAIVMKAMRKEPHLRYGSAFEFSEDIQRHLTGLPVQALQGNWSYVTGKFIRRHKLGLAMIFVILVFAAWTTYLWRDAVHAKERAELLQAEAESERTKSQTVLSLLLEMITSVDPDQAKGEEVTVREALDQGLKKVYSPELTDQPEIQADVLGTLGSSYHKLGIWNQARKVRGDALRIRQEHLPEDLEALATDLSNLGSTLYSSGDFEAAALYFKKAIAMRHQLGEEEDRMHRVMYNLASVLTKQGKYEEAEDIHTRVLRVRQELGGDNSLAIASSLYSLGALRLNQGRLEEAESMLNDALDLRIKKLGQKSTHVARVLSSLGKVSYYGGRLEEARSRYESSLKIRRELLEEGHISIANTKKQLAELFLEMGDLATAKSLLDEAIPSIRHAKSSDSWAVAHADNVFGLYLLLTKRYSESEPYLLSSYETFQKTTGTNNIDFWRAAVRLVTLYENWGRPEKASMYRNDLPSKKR